MYSKPESSNIKHVLKYIDSIIFPYDEFIELFDYLREERQTGQIILFSTYIEKSMMTLLRSHLVDIDSRSKSDDVFGGSGPFSTFSNRIKGAYHLGWLRATTKNKIEKFRLLRNEFAHEAYIARANSKKIRPYISAMAYDPNTIMGEANEKLAKIGHPVNFSYEGKDDLVLLMNFLQLASDTILDLHILPACKMGFVHPNEVNMLDSNQIRRSFFANMWVLTKLFGYADDQQAIDEILESLKKEALS